MTKNKLANIAIYFKIAALWVATGFVLSCSPYKKVPDNTYLVKKVELSVNNKKKTIPEEGLIKQQPNEKLFYIWPIKMDIYSLSVSKPDSISKEFKKNHKFLEKVLLAMFSEKGIKRLDTTYVKINNFFVKSGEAPVLFNTEKTLASENAISSYYFNRGYFDVNTNYKTSTKEQDITVDYKVETGSAYTIQDYSVNISSPLIKELYAEAQKGCLIKQGQQYDTKIIADERQRLINFFRQNGVFDFSENNISFSIDTNGFKNSAKITMAIFKESLKNDNPYTFKQYKVKNIRVISDFSYLNTSNIFGDSTTYNGIDILSHDNKLPYKGRLLSDAILIKKDELLRLSEYDDTYKVLRALRLFQTINISVNILDSQESDFVGYVDVTVLLSPVKKYYSSLNLEVSRSSLLGFGTTGNLNLTKNNTFKNGEIWTNSLRFTLGSYYSPEDTKRGFLNAYEVSLNSSLSFPKFLLPFNTEGLVPKRYVPKTNISLGFGMQKNIGLDRNYFNAAIEYLWDEGRLKQHKFTLFKFSYLANTNKFNYYNVFSSQSRDDALLAYSVSNPQWYYPDNKSDGQYIVKMETAAFEDQSFKNNYPNYYRTLADDLYQFNRYTSNYLIPAIGYTFTFNNQRYDKAKDYHYLQVDFMAAGNLTGLMANAFKYPTIKAPTGEESYTIFGVPFAQFVKLNTTYSRYHRLDKNNLLAYRVYLGAAFPYGNTPYSVPFSEMYFGGGANYERGWLAYELGPGSNPDKSFSYNAANLKFTASLEYRFRVYKSLYGAIFADAGNIWFTKREMALNDEAVFAWDRFYKEISLSTGIGLRYDFDFFILRLDMAFKTYDPSLPDGDRWCFNKRHFKSPVFQFALAYPF